MPIPRIAGQWNKAGLNPGHPAHRPPDARLRRRHPPWPPLRERISDTGQLFATEDGYVLALTYGPDTDWVKNVLAAGGCELRTRGRVIRLASPRLFHDETRRAIRPLERQVLRVLGVADFLSLTTAPAAAPAAGQP